MNNMLNLIDKIPIFGHLLKEANKSTYKHKLASCLISGGRIIAIGHNQLRHHKIGSRWSEYPESLHSEVACITSINKDKIKNATLYVLRISNGSSPRPMLAKPCSNCSELIKWVGGIKKVIYSVPEYPFVKDVKIDDLI